MGDVTILDCETRLGIPVERILEGVNPELLDEILILGWDNEGELYAASSTGKTPELLHLIDMFKHKLLDGDYDE